MEIKEFDNALMELSHEIRECREMTQKFTRSYPEHVRTSAAALENNMLHADLIVGQARQMLFEQRIALLKTYMYMSTNESESE